MPYSLAPVGERLRLGEPSCETWLDGSKRKSKGQSAKASGEEGKMRRRVAGTTGRQTPMGHGQKY